MATEQVRLWHDDVRPNPKGWVWARTNERAKQILREGNVIQCSLDHDMGFHDVELPEDPDELAEVLFLKGRSAETGLDLVHWMIQKKLVPPVVRIHSWNPDGTRSMAAALNRHGYDCEIRVFNAKELVPEKVS